MSNIFLSHSSEDYAFARMLASEIESKFVGATVFASTKPDAIPSGALWFPVVIANLEKADALVVLITESSVDSVWVGFEVGYFWKRMNSKGIFILYHPKANIPSPLDTLQAKKVTVGDELKSFFDDLCTHLGKSDCPEFNVDRLARSADSIAVNPPNRSIATFERFLESAHWDKIHNQDAKETWICEEDALFHIVIDYSRGDDFSEEWTQSFPSSILGGDKATAYPVELRISNVSMKAFRFISVDGGRYFVPMPEIELVKGQEGQRRFYWQKDSLYYKTAKIISYFYHIHSSFEDFAKHAGIDIR